MKWKAFTQDEMVELRSNPYTLRVTDKTIMFTLAFKEAFWDSLQAGISPVTIIRQLGYDSEILGYTRIWGISQHIRNEAESAEGLHEGRHLYNQLFPMGTVYHKYSSPTCQALLGSVFHRTI